MDKIIITWMDNGVAHGHAEFELTPQGKIQAMSYLKNIRSSYPSVVFKVYKGTEVNIREKTVVIEYEMLED